jgi:hypothetical protein
LYESYLAKAHAELGKFVDAWRCIGEATRAAETTKETMFEAEVYRIAGEIAFQSPERTGESASLFRALTRRRRPATSQILGTPRRNEPRVSRASRSKRADCLLRFTAGSLKASTHAI